MNERRHRHTSNGLPPWLNATVILVLLGNFTWNVFVIGPPAYPTNVLIAGLLGGYIGTDLLIRRRQERNPPPAPPTPPEPPDGGASP